MAQAQVAGVERLTPSHYWEMGGTLHVKEETTLRLVRLDGDSLVVEGAALSKAFFAQDASSVGAGSYDSLAGQTSVDTIETSDIEALNRTMRARTAHSRWAPITGIHLSWLEEIDPILDLIEADDAQWELADGERLVGAALTAVVGQGRGVAVATKMLHLKRPRLFPILDRFVVEILGGRIPDDALPNIRAQEATRLVVHLRRQGRDNVHALKEIQAQLSKQGFERSLVRILDAILWPSHPAGRIPSARVYKIEGA